MNLIELSEVAADPIVIRSRSRVFADDVRWYASMESAEFKNHPNDPMLVSFFGDGQTPHMALLNYAKRISGKIMVLNAQGPGRREIGLAEVTP